MAQYNLIVDSREGDIINKFKSMNITFTIAQLDLGDIIINPLNKHNKSVLIERKTITDLIASIKDGRYKEQKARLSVLDNKYFFIIEGNGYNSLREQDKKMFHGALISTQFRDKIDIVRTFDIDETVVFIIRLMERMEKVIKTGDGDELFNSHISPESKYIDVIKTKKKENITYEICQCMALSTVPSVNKITASAIIKYYGSFAGLIEAYTYEETKKDKELMISKIMLASGRHIGESISKKIYYYLFNDNSNPDNIDAENLEDEKEE